MLNNRLLKQTLVAILLTGPAFADPPHAREPIRRFDDWRLDCTVTPCITHTGVQGADGSEVLRLSRLPGDPSTVVISTPLALYLPDGLLLSIGTAPAQPLVWRTCGPDGCEARLPVTPDLAASLRRERQASLTFTPADGVPVRLGLSLIGYVASLRAAAR